MRFDRRTTTTITDAAPRLEATHVGVVASRRTTRDDLAHYLSDSGFRADGLTALHEEELRGDVRALVFFPDDFEPAAVRQFLDTLRRVRPQLLVVVVTRAPGALAHALAPRAGTITPVVLPRPPFGWSIVDTLRGHLVAEGE